MHQRKIICGTFKFRLMEISSGELGVYVCDILNMFKIIPDDLRSLPLIKIYSNHISLADLKSFAFICASLAASGNELALDFIQKSITSNLWQ